MFLAFSSILGLLLAENKLIVISRFLGNFQNWEGATVRRWRIIGIFMITATSVLTAGIAAAQWEPISMSYEVDQQQITLEDSVCFGYSLRIEIGNDQRKACVYDSSLLRFAVHTDSRGRTKTAVAAGTNQTFVEIRGLCSSTQQCFYLPRYDKVIAGASRSGGGLRLVQFEHFSERLFYNMVDGEYSYQGSSTPVFPPLNTTAQVMAGALSSNHQWGVFIIKNQGIVVVNFETMATRRIAAPGFTYGVGMDPKPYFAISNNGKYVLVTGRNAGPLMYEVDDTCGDTLHEPIGKKFPAGIRACRVVHFNLSNYLPAINTTANPYISSDGLFVAFAVQTRDGVKWQVRVDTNGSSPTDKVMLLGLGDSFSSGEGELDDAWYREHTAVAPDLCHTSVRSYPYLIGQYFGLSGDAVYNIACSGATSHDIIASDNYKGQGGRLGSMDEENLVIAREQARAQFIPGRLPQLEFVERVQPTIITVGIGGNDAGFMKKLAACAMPSTCDWAQPGERRAQVLKELQALYPRFIEVYQGLSRASPSSKIYAVGYPRIAEVDGSCDSVTGLLFDRTEREFMKEATVYLNEVMKAAALTAGAGFLDTAEAFTGEMLCSDNPVAMNGLRLGDDMDIAGISILRVIGNESFHPTPKGHARIASRFIADFPGAITEPQCRLGETQCAVPTPVPAPSLYWGETTATSRLRSETLAVTQSDDLVITVPKGYFAPHSLVTVEIHSNPHSFGQFEVDETGALTTVLPLPQDIDDGYHTVYVTGVSPLDETVTLYDLTRVGQTAEMSKAGPVALLQSNHSTVAAKQEDLLSQSITLPAKTPKTSNAPLKSDKQVKGVTKVTKEMVQPSKAKQLGDHLPKIIIGAGALMVGVFITVFLLRRRF